MFFFNAKLAIKDEKTAVVVEHLVFFCIHKTYMFSEKQSARALDLMFLLQYYGLHNTLALSFLVFFSQEHSILTSQQQV